MPSIEDRIRTQIANIEASTGRSLADWIAIVRGFGDDVELAPKKTYVSPGVGSSSPRSGRRRGTRGQPQPAGNEATDRLRPTSGMATHRVRITDAAGLDAELVGWLREAYERA